MNTEIKKEQNNTYYIIDSMGRNTNKAVIASNIKDAYVEAKKIVKDLGISYYKLKRSYNGGVRG